MTDTISAELAFAAESELGEGHFWDVAIGTLVWLDVLAERLHRSDPASGITTTLELERTPGALGPQSTGGLIAAVAGGFAALDKLGQLEMSYP
jgi:sugar lactone lactonase YvrE